MFHCHNPVKHQQLKGFLEKVWKQSLELNIANFEGNEFSNVSSSFFEKKISLLIQISFLINIFCLKRVT